MKADTPKCDCWL